MSEQQEQKISVISKNFIEEVTKEYNLSEEQKKELKRIAIEDTNKLYNYSLEVR
jgi:hypothetical protein